MISDCNGGSNVYEAIVGFYGLEFSGLDHGNSLRFKAI